MKLPLNYWNEFAEDESGAGTAFGLMWAVICLLIGGLSIDYAHVLAVEQRLQSATDIAAHAAALELRTPDQNGVATPASRAMASMARNMPVATYGMPVNLSTVEIGNWNSETRTMTQVGVQNAVRVTARLDGNYGTRVPTFILKMIGVRDWAISAQAVFLVAKADCFNDGFIAGGEVDISSNNTFDNGFCIHGNAGVDVNSNIYFGDGVRVTMPNSNLVADGGMFAERGTNHIYENGRSNQIGDQFLEPVLATAASINEMYVNLSDPAHADQPAYISDMTINHVSISNGGGNGGGGNGNGGGGNGNGNGNGGGGNGGGGSIADLVANAVNIVDCTSLNFGAGDLVENMVIVANCNIRFSAGALVENSIIITNDTGNQSMHAAASMQMGTDDHCAAGGGVTLITMGKAHFSAQSHWYGAQLIAHDDVHISANTDGIEGLSVQTMGDIKATSNLDMGLCGGGVDHYAEQHLVRMVY